MTNGEGVFGEEVGVDGVFDVDHVDAVLAITDDAQTAGAGTGKHAGNEVRVADAPDEVRAERDGAQGGGIGGENFALGDGFGEGIRARAGGSEREGFVGVGEGVSVINDAGGAGVDETGDAVFAGAGEEGASAEDVGAVKIFVAAPDAHFGGGVEDGRDTGASGLDGGGVVERSADEADAAGLEVGRGSTAEDRDGAAGGEEALDEAAAEKAGAAGDESRRGVSHGIYGIHGRGGKPEESGSGVARGVHLLTLSATV
jgi:hypothetical protein